MIELGNYLQKFEVEKQKLHAQVNRLCQENVWLRHELGLTQQQLHESEQTNATYTMELERLRLFEAIQQVDDDNKGSSIRTISEQNRDSGNQQINEQDLLNDLFPLDDNDNEQNLRLDAQENRLKDSNSADNLSQTASSSITSTDSYEISTRL